MYDPVVQFSQDFPNPSSQGSPSSLAAEPDDDHDYSPPELRLRQAIFPEDESLEGVDEMSLEGVDAVSDVLMTPAESELDDDEAASSPAPK